MTSKTRGKGNSKEGKKDARQRNALDIMQEKEQISTSLNKKVLGGNYTLVPSVNYHYIGLDIVLCRPWITKF